jgi:RNA polymerase sigma factor (sigma-70 family)
MKSKDPAGTLVTSTALLRGIKDLDDNTSWQEFTRTYGRLLRGLAFKQGLSPEETEDALQETWLAVSRQIGNFVYDPAKSSFKRWLGTLAKGCIVDQLRKRPPRGCMAVLPQDPATSTDPLAALPDPAGVDADEFWNSEFEKTVRDAALERLKRKVKPLQYQMFHLYVGRGLPAAAVARALGVSAGRVYLNKKRVMGTFLKLAAKLQQQPAQGSGGASGK